MSTTPRSPMLGATRPLPAAALAAGVLIAAAVFLRAWQLENIPGVNGDEAWSGVQAWHWAHGQPFAWRTPTGNVVNVFFLGPLALLHCWWPPSFVVLRSVAVVSGLSALALNWWLCRRTFDRATAVASTVALAVLPIAIAYSRFAWDSCQTPAASVLVLYAGLSIAQCRRWQRRAALAGAALAAAAIVHPTNVLLAPLVAVPLVWRACRERGERPDAAQMPRRWWPWVAACAGVVVAAVVVVQIAPAEWSAWRQPLVARTAAGLHRAFDLREYLAFAVHFVRLFSGETVYRYLSGAIPHQVGSWPSWRDVGPLDVVAWAVLALCLVGAWRGSRAAGAVVDRCLLLGWLLLVAGFYLVAGPEAVAPHFERYGMCLVVPTVLLAARGMCWWGEQGGQVRIAVHAISLATAAAVVSAFCVQYFGFIEQTGGRSHIAFRTGPVEPKLAAWRTIAGQSSGTATIVADSWWTYWPLAYLASNAAPVRVLLDDTGTPRVPATTAGDVWQVACAASDDDAARSGRAWPPEDGWERICDFSGRVALAVRRQPVETREKN